MSVDPDITSARPGLGNLKRAAIAGCLIVLLTATTVASATLLEVDQLVGIIQKNTHKLKGLGPVLGDVPDGGPQTILVIGADKRYKTVQRGLPARSDTMILARLDPDRGATAVLSIPRDLRVPIPGGGIGKINGAYALGGPKKVVETVTQYTGLTINHVMVIDFGGFHRAVDRLGCVYTDIDHRYYHSNAGLPPSAQFAEIDIKPGYQKLCGPKSLDYVRFRHTDSDLVRADRQHDFLAQAKTQFSLSSIFGDREKLLEILSDYTSTDIEKKDAILRLLKLAYKSSQKPIRTVRFGPVFDVGAYDLGISASNLQHVVRQFRAVRASAPTKVPGVKSTTSSKQDRRRKHRRSRAASTLPPGMIYDRTAGEDLGIQIAAQMKRGLPVYFPTARLSNSQYTSGERDYPAWRAYTIRDRDNHPYDAYRLVLRNGAPAGGQYFGIQGTAWKSPPALDNPTSEIKKGGRTFKLYGDGHRLRFVAWSTPRGSYWVSNTLSQTLTNKQMIAIARTLTRPGF